MASKLLCQKFPNTRIIVVVPTDALQSQWQEQLFEMGLAGQAEVIIINTLVKNHHECYLLILDEAHRYASPLFSQVFTKVKYKFILALSATMERLDGKHELLYKYCPVVDRINDLEAIANGWVAQSIEYKVILDVPDIDIYKQITKLNNNTGQLVLKDNGVGIDNPDKITKNLGCEIIKNLTKQLDGKIELIQYENGTGYKLTFPLDMEHTIEG